MIQPQLPQPPVSHSNHPVKYAKFWERVLAILMDTIILSLFSAIVGALFGVLYFLSKGSPKMSPANTEELKMIGRAIGSTLNWLYFTCLESSEKQATFGKQIMGIQVTDLNGQRLSFGRANGRYFSKIVSTLTLGIGFLMPLFDNQKQALHDKMSGCLLIKR